MEHGSNTNLRRCPRFVVRAVEKCTSTFGARVVSRWKKVLRFHTWQDRLPPVKRIIDRESEFRLRKLQTQEL
jgi:hypothetical protein